MLDAFLEHPFFLNRYRCVTLMSVLFALNNEEYVCRNVCQPMCCVIPTLAAGRTDCRSHQNTVPIRPSSKGRWTREYPIIGLAVFCVLTPSLESLC